MIAGMTGTQIGMTTDQIISLDVLVNKLHITEIHHGDCIGADKEFHDLCCTYGSRKPKIVIHPPENNKKRAYCKGGMMMQPKDYLSRNRDIVDASQIMFGIPKGEEESRSGTWSTIRYTKRMKKELYIVWPDGDVEHFHEYP